MNYSQNQTDGQAAIDRLEMFAHRAESMLPDCIKKYRQGVIVRCLMNSSTQRHTIIKDLSTPDEAPQLKYFIDYLKWIYHGNHIIYVNMNRILTPSLSPGKLFRDSLINQNDGNTFDTQSAKNFDTIVMIDGFSNLAKRIGFKCAAQTASRMVLSLMDEKRRDENREYNSLKTGWRFIWPIASIHEAEYSLYGRLCYGFTLYSYLNGEPNDIQTPQSNIIDISFERNRKND